MLAMVLNKPGEMLKPEQRPIPALSFGRLLVRVAACGVCRTDLHVLDGELESVKQPVIPGHQIVGYIEKLGPGVESFQIGQRVGVPWLGGSCGHCNFCNTGKENLCGDALYTGYQTDGGFAEYATADARYCFLLPDGYSDLQVAPLLCAGLIGYRAYRRAADSQTIGLYGFGAAAHILIQVACHKGQSVYAFTREGDVEAQQFAKKLGAVWAGDSTQSPPQTLDAAIIFAPDGQLVTQALKAVSKGGKVICAGIHMSDIPSFPYKWLWGERSIESIANLTRQDALEFLPLAASIPVKTEVHAYPLSEVNMALDDLRHGRFTGAAVVVP